jgi:hypothetical protein
LPAVFFDSEKTSIQLLQIRLIRIYNFGMQAKNMLQPSNAPTLQGEQEMLVWMRHLGKSQMRVGEVYEALRNQDARIQQMQTQLMQLRAWRVIEHTQKLWGIQTPVMWKTEAKPANRGVKLLGVAGRAWQRLTNRVICQTGCEGHGHPWLNEQGQCTRTGEVCDAMVQETKRHA